jgi:hypothetical protein
MAGGAAGGGGSPWLRKRVHRLEEKGGTAAFLPCSKATAEKMNNGDGVVAEICGDDELVWRSGGQGRSSTRRRERGPGARKAQ